MKDDAPMDLVNRAPAVAPQTRAPALPHSIRLPAPQVDLDSNQNIQSVGFTTHAPNFSPAGDVVADAGSLVAVFSLVSQDL